MKESNESIIIKQIHDLLHQLESTASKGVAPQTREFISEKLLQISCDRYWVYDPMINTVVLHLLHDENGNAFTITRSLTTLQANIKLEDRIKINASFERLLDSKSNQEKFTYSERKNDALSTYDVVACNYEMDNHKKIIGVTRIVNKQAQSMESLLLVQQKFEILMGLSSTFIWQYDVHNHEVTANQSLCEKLHLENRAYSVNELSTIVEIAEMDDFVNHLESKTLKERGIVHVHSVTNNFTYIFETDFKPVCNAYGDYLLMIGTMIDITEHEMLRAMASKDSLTGCYNRNMADVTLESSFQSYQKTGDLFTIIFFDIDKFKQVNDRYGHDMGDFVLTNVCSRISQEIRSNDMMFRWGGDEFLLICKGISKENIYGYIDRLRRNIESSTFEFKGTKLQLTISIGAAIFYKNDPDFSYAMKRADRSLYKAKLAGRNKVCMLN